MRRSWTAVMAALVGVLVLTSRTSGQTLVQLRWTPGQVFVYRIEHSTASYDSVETAKTETKSTVRLTRRWQVQAVDAAGVATLVMSLSALQQENTLPGGEVLKYDSADPDKGSPQLKAYLSKFLNVPLATLRVDSLGNVVEVKESRLGNPASYQNELPFMALLPAEGMKAGHVWERPYQITLVPPLGTGEKYDAARRFTCKALTADLATVTVEPTLKTTLKAPADVMPLWQVMPTGEVVYDVKNGRVQSATMKIEQQLKGHIGENSETRFQSLYTLQYVGDK
jgi:hypothetical protein